MNAPQDKPEPQQPPNPMINDLLKAIHDIQDEYTKNLKKQDAKKPGKDWKPLFIHTEEEIL